MYFGYSADYSLLFVSLQSSRHMGNLQACPEVAVAIYSTDQPPGGHVSAIQMKGSAAPVSDGQVPQACAEYFSRPGAAIAMGVDVPNRADFQGEEPETWKFVRVRPLELWYFDSRYFGEHRAPVPARLWQA